MSASGLTLPRLRLPYAAVLPGALRAHLLLTAGLLLFALVVAWGLTLDPFDVSLRRGLRPPSWAHPLGTDHLGRDLFARIAHGFLIDLGLSLAILSLSLLLGLALGLAAGYLGGAVDTVVMTSTDLVASLPAIVVALVVSLQLGYGAAALIVALALTGWTKFARVARAEALRLRETDFVAMTRVLGASHARLLLMHVLPNALPAMTGLIALQLGHNALNIAALGFLGVGVQPPTPEWGAIVIEGRPYISRAPWLAVFPGIALAAFTLLTVAVAAAVTRRSAPAETILAGERS